MMQQLDTLTQMVQSLSTRSKLLKTLVEQVRDNVSMKKVKIDCRLANDDSVTLGSVRNRFDAVRLSSRSCRPAWMKPRRGWPS